MSLACLASAQHEAISQIEDNSPNAAPLQALSNPYMGHLAFYIKGCCTPEPLGLGAYLDSFPAKCHPMKCLQVGDWGRDGQLNQTEVAQAMARVAEEYKPSFIISTGQQAVAYRLP